jgi:hypothetical protein
VWRLWEELQAQYPSFEFTHEWGLGILQTGPAGDSCGFLQALFHGSEPDRAFLRHYYETQAKALECECLSARAAASDKPYVQVFTTRSGEYNEEHSVRAEVRADEWDRHVLSFPDGGGTGRIRIDPANCPSVIDIAGVQIRRAVDGAVLFEWTDPEEIRSFDCSAQLVPLIGKNGGGPARFLSTGSDPRLMLPQLDSAVTDQPLSIEIWMRMSTELSEAISLLRSATTEADASLQELGTIRSEREYTLQELGIVRNERDDALKELGIVRNERDRVRQELGGTRTAHERLLQQFAAVQDRLQVSELREQTLESEVRLLQHRQQVANDEIRRLIAERDALLPRIDEARRENEREQNLRIDLERQIQEWRRAAENERRRQAELLESWSWRITAPLRMLFGLTRTARRE